MTSTVSRTFPSIPHVPGLPLLGNLLAFRRDRLGLTDDAAKIGPITRVMLGNIPLYVVTDADVAHSVMTDEQAGSFVKTAGLQFLRPMLGDGLLLAEGATHKRHRKLLAPAFAPKRLEKYGDIMVEETVKQLASWRTGQRIDIARHMMELTLAIVGRTMFGADVRSDAAQVAEAIELGMRAQEAMLSSPIPVSYKWPLPRNRMMRRSAQLLDEVVYRLIAEGRARGTDRGDVLSILLMARDAEGGLSDKEVRDEVMTLMLAGHETTANALTWTWFELGRNPAVMARLTSEVDTLGGRTVTVDDLPNLPFNLAVIDEAMRLHPPAYLMGREATADVTVGGHRLPKGSVVILNIRGIHRRADYFPDPMAFRPERMLPEEKKLRPRHHYFPFGGGARVCIGSHFALLEAQLALATMVQRARLKVIPTHVEPEPLVTLRPRGGMPAVVELRG